MKLPIRFSPENPAIEPPSYMSAGAAGFDLRADIAATHIIEPGKRVLVPTGLYVAVPEGYEMQIRPRSGLSAKQGITVINTPGTVDSDYRGEVKVALVNLDDQPRAISPGDRIAQAVISPVIQCEIEMVDDLPDTERGAGGFGSTGIK